MMDLIKCGENLREARKNKGLTQKAFAERLGQKPSYSNNVSYWETGKQPVPEKHREKVAHELGISEFEFVSTIGYVYLFHYRDAESEENNTYRVKLVVLNNQLSTGFGLKWMSGGTMRCLRFS